MVCKYEKKPVVIEAIEFTRKNIDEIQKFTIGKAFNFIIERGMYSKCFCSIETLEGIVIAIEGDYIIKGTAGEIYPCKPAIFNDIYKKI